MHKSLLPGMLMMLTFTAVAEPSGDSDLPDWTVERIDPLHDRLSRWVNNSSRSIDGFFGTDEHLAVRNRSYLRLSQEFEWEESEGIDNDTSIRFKLDLPTTKDRLRLIIESDPEETQGTLSEQQANRLGAEQPGSGNTILGLSQLGGDDKTIGWETSAGAGIKFRFPLDPYVRLTAERLWDVGEGPWQLESYNRASWFNSDGYRVRTRWDLGRPLDDTQHLRFITHVQWQEDEDTLEFSESIELNQILGKRSAIRYAGIVIGSSLSHTRVEDYVLLAQYRRNLHRNILFADIVPELRFPREANFAPRWGLVLRVEMFFRGEVVDRRQSAMPTDDARGYSPERITQAFETALGSRHPPALYAQPISWPNTNNRYGPMGQTPRTQASMLANANRFGQL
ncbi:hypothetical protein [Pseudomonas profundi]|uniref:hypothetical protein n=1 Tax=Pseudomonas profundi TaxID=1981513 RepID=UPI001680CF97|nr:hypothetical protein [Pseudomonas profundi]